MDTERGRFVDEAEATPEMPRVEVGEVLVIRGSRLRALRFTDREMLLELLTPAGKLDQMPKVEALEVVVLKGAQLQVVAIDDREMTLKLLSRVEREHARASSNFDQTSADESERHLERVLGRQRHRGKPRKGRT